MGLNVRGREMAGHNFGGEEIWGWEDDYEREDDDREGNPRDRTLTSSGKRKHGGSLGSKKITIPGGFMVPHKKKSVKEGR